MKDGAGKEYRMSRKKRLYTKGWRAERKVMDILERMGYLCIRAPASGARAKHLSYPDVLCVKPSKCITLAIEVKYRKENENVYLLEHQYENLLKWKEAGAVSLVAVAVKGGTVKAVPLKWVEKNEGRYKAKINRAIVEMADDLMSFVEMLESSGDGV